MTPDLSYDYIYTRYTAAVGKIEEARANIVNGMGKNNKTKKGTIHINSTRYSYKVAVDYVPGIRTLDGNTRTV